MPAGKTDRREHHVLCEKHGQGHFIVKNENRGGYNTILYYTRLLLMMVYPGRGILLITVASAATTLLISKIGTQS